MKSEWQIHMDFNKAMRAAEKLRQISRNMNNNASSLGSTMTSIDGSWDGENSENYIAKGKKVEGKVTRTATDINKVASTVEEIAIRTRDAELAAIRIAED
jgi:uncharacterized protein YukE